MARQSKKTEHLGFKVTKAERAMLEDTAKRRGLTLSRFLTDAALLMAGMEDGFLNQLEDAADRTKFDVPTVLTNLFLTYVATDAALLKVFGHSQTYRRAFQFDDQGTLLTGDRLATKIADDVSRIGEDLKDRLEKNASGEKPEGVLLSTEHVTIIADHLKPMASVQ